MEFRLFHFGWPLAAPSFPVTGTGATSSDSPGQESATHENSVESLAGSTADGFASEALTN